MLLVKPLPVVHQPGKKVTTTRTTTKQQARTSCTSQFRTTSEFCIEIVRPFPFCRISVLYQSDLASSTTVYQRYTQAFRSFTRQLDNTGTRITCDVRLQLGPVALDKILPSRLKPPFLRGNRISLSFRFENRVPSLFITTTNFASHFLSRLDSTPVRHSRSDHASITIPDATTTLPTNSATIYLLHSGDTS